MLRRAGKAARGRKAILIRVPGTRLALPMRGAGLCSIAIWRANRLLAISKELSWPGFAQYRD